jgi:hypothetical protein
MTREDIQLLYKYDRWANNRVLQAASALSGEAFTSDQTGLRRSTMANGVPQARSQTCEPAEQVPQDIRCDAGQANQHGGIVDSGRSRSRHPGLLRAVRCGRRSQREPQANAAQPNDA